MSPTNLIFGPFLNTLTHFVINDTKTLRRRRNNSQKKNYIFLIIHFISEKETADNIFKGFEYFVQIHILSVLQWLVGLKPIQLEQQKTQVPLIILAKNLKPIVCRVIKST